MELLPEYLREQLVRVDPSKNVARCLICDILIMALHKVALNDRTHTSNQLYS